MGVEKVDLEAFRCDFFLQNSQFGHLEPFCILFYCSSFLPGGKMVEKVDLEASGCDLKPQIGQFGHLELFFSTFLLFEFSRAE